MLSGDPALREQLRDLPTGYLLDLLAEPDGEGGHAIRDILRERGLEPEEIDHRVTRRTTSRLPHGHVLWKAVRIFTIVSALLVSGFDLVAYYRLLHGSSPLRGTLLLLSVACIAFGFFLGYKLTTHVYQGARHELYCGFPFPVGSVDLRTGRETVKPGLPMIAGMAANAMVGLSLLLFPLLLIHYLLT